eukprot:291139_1
MQIASNQVNQTKLPLSQQSQSLSSKDKNKENDKVINYQRHTYKRSNPKSPIKRLGTNGNDAKKNKRQRSAKHQRETKEKQIKTSQPQHHSYNLRRRKNR